MLVINIYGLTFVMIVFEITHAKKENLIVRGQTAEIDKFPYSAFLAVTCVQPYIATNHMCVASIVNQDVLLTAAHCYYGCQDTSDVAITVGHRHRDKGVKSSLKKFHLHQHYDEASLANDIALILLKTRLNLNSNVSRIALTKDPPKEKVGLVAGWGFVDEINLVGTKTLHFTKQEIISRKDCIKKIGMVIPHGSFCGGRKNAKSYVAKGDSGSALVVDGFIQIGLVSVKQITISRSIGIYTDTAYFYDWIAKNAAKLLCNEKEKNNEIENIQHSDKKDNIEKTHETDKIEKSYETKQSEKKHNTDKKEKIHEEDKKKKIPVRDNKDEIYVMDKIEEIAVTDKKEEIPVTDKIKKIHEKDEKDKKGKKDKIYVTDDIDNIPVAVEEDDHYF